MKNKGTGFYLVLASAVLAIVAMIVYPFVMYVQLITYLPLAINVILVASTIVISNKKGNLPYMEILPVCSAMCMGFGMALAVGKMVNEIGYVISGLDPISFIATFIAFEAICLVGMILCMVGSFLNQTKTSNVEIVTE